jgi:hypothetical protein
MPGVRSANKAASSERQVNPSMLILAHAEDLSVFIVAASEFLARGVWAVELSYGGHAFELSFLVHPKDREPPSATNALGLVRVLVDAHPAARRAISISTCARFASRLRALAAMVRRRPRRRLRVGAPTITAVVRVLGVTALDARAAASRLRCRSPTRAAALSYCSLDRQCVHRAPQQGLHS